MLRYSNSLLLIAAICGAVFVARASTKYHQVLDEHKQLAAEVGIVSVKDQDKIHVVRLDTGDPLHFAWQIFLPRNHTYEWRSSPFLLPLSKDSYTEDHRFIARVRYRKLEGRWHEAILIRGSAHLRELPEHSFDRLEEWRFEAGRVGEPTLHEPGTVIIELFSLQQIATGEQSVSPFSSLLFATDTAFAREKAKSDRVKLQESESRERPK